MSTITSLRSSVSASSVQLLMAGRTGKPDDRSVSPARPTIFADDRASRAAARIVSILLDSQGNADVKVNAHGATVSASTDDGDDRIAIRAQAADIVDAGGGEDQIVIRTGGKLNRYGDYLMPSVDRVEGGSGNDTISIATHGGAARIYGGSGDDVIGVVSRFTHGDRNEFFTGVDNVDGGDGDDRLALSATLDVTRISGGAGNDTIGITAGRSADNIEGGDGDDAISISTAGAADRIDGGDGDDVIAITARSVWLLDGGNGDDTIAVAAEEATVNGGAGNDAIAVSAISAGVQGGGGDDTIAITADRISVRGGAGNDRMVLNGTSGRAAMVYMAEGDGHDVVETNTAITIGRFNDLGTMRLDMANAKVTRGDDGTLTVSFSDSSDTLTVKLTGDMAGKGLAFDYDRSGQLLTIRAAGEPARMAWQ